MLVFPAVLSLAGGYLLFRGIARKTQARESVIGNVASSGPLESHVTGQKCAYSKVIVEYYQRGGSPWKEIYSLEARVPFRLGAKSVDPSHATYHLAPPKTFEGYLRPNPGLFDTIGPTVRQMRGIADFTSEVSAGEILDEKVLRTVLALPGAKERMKNYMNGAIRVSEYCLPNGTGISVAMDPAASQIPGGAIAGSLEFPLAISVAGAESVMNEKAFMSIALGGFLLLLALGVAILALS